MAPRVVVVMVVVVMAMVVVVASQRPFKDHSRPWGNDPRPPLGHSNSHFIHHEGPRSSFNLRTSTPHKDISHRPRPPRPPSSPPSRVPIGHSSGHSRPISFSVPREEDVFRPIPRPRPRPPPPRPKIHRNSPPPHSKPTQHSFPPHSKPFNHSPPQHSKPTQHSPPQHSKPFNHSPPQHSKPPPHSPPPSPPHSKPPHHSGSSQPPPHRKTQGGFFTTTRQEHKDEGPGGCQTKEGFFFAGQTWFVKGCRRRKCIHFRGKFFTETDSCDSEIFNTTYKCVIQVDTTADYPRCCPTYKCNPDNLGNSV